MAIKLVANYSKKIGLPEYSSHSFSVSIESEVADISQVEQECSRLYRVLQHSVDQEIQNTGFTPQPANHNGNGSGHKPNGNNFDRWECTDGQKNFILRIVNEHKLDKQDVEDLAKQMFGVGVKQLNRMQASQLIQELLTKVGKSPARNRWRQPTNTQ